MDTPRNVTPGRLARLTEELVEERLGVVERSSVPEVLVDEIDYALRPPRHERRVPSYGSFVLPERPVDEWHDGTGLDVVTSSTFPGTWRRTTGTKPKPDCRNQYQ